MILEKNKKKFSALLLILVILLNIHLSFAEETPENSTTADNPPPPRDSNVFVLGGIRPSSELMSDAIYVFNTSTDILVYSKNADKKIFPASTTKIMTALVVLENERDLDRRVEAPFLAFDEFVGSDRNKIGAASAAFAPLQENLTVRDALYGMMLPSGCDAANILAYHVGGDSQVEPEDRIPAFIAMMNEKAKEIGCTGTNFSNPHGLFEPENYSTVRDIFLITQYAYEHYPRLFADLVSETEYQMPPNSSNPEGYAVHNTNWMIQNTSNNPYFYELASGVKTGGFDEYHIRNADGGWDDYDGIANLVSIAKRDEFEYMVVTVGAPWHIPEEPGERGLHYAFRDHRALFNWAFSTFEYTRVLKTTDPHGYVNILEGEEDRINLFPQMENDFWTLLPRDIDVASAIDKRTTTIVDEIEAPVEIGTVLGTIELILANETLAKFPLVTRNAVEKTQTAQMRDGFREIFYYMPMDEDGNPADEEALRPWVIPVLVGTAALLIALIILNYIRKHRKQKNRDSRKPPNRRIRR